MTDSQEQRVKEAAKRLRDELRRSVGTEWRDNIEREDFEVVLRAVLETTDSEESLNPTHKSSDMNPR